MTCTLVPGTPTPSPCCRPCPRRSRWAARPTAAGGAGSGSGWPGTSRARSTRRPRAASTPAAGRHRTSARRRRRRWWRGRRDTWQPATSPRTAEGRRPGGSAGGQTRSGHAIGADLVHPLTVGPAPHILAWRDDLTTDLADLARGVRLVVAQPRAVLVAHASVFRRAAQVFQQSFF